MTSLCPQRAPGCRVTDYVYEAVETEIRKDPRISPREAKMIHALLKGHER